MLCQSVWSFHSPVCWSFCRQLVAIENVATDVPFGVNLDSASLPRFPIRITLFTLRDAIFPCNVPRKRMLDVGRPGRPSGPRAGTRVNPPFELCRLRPCDGS